MSSLNLRYIIMSTFQKNEAEGVGLLILKKILMAGDFSTPHS